MRLRFPLLILILLTAANIATAQVKAPPLPQMYHADIRYRIEADRSGRVRIFRAMEAELKELGFVPDVREDSDLDILDPNADRMPGTISSANAEKLLGVTAVQAVLLRNVESALPEDINKPVQVNLKLAGGLDPTTQRLLHEQAIMQLKGLGFVPSVGYDHRGFNRIRGSLPAGQVPNLLKDLRGQPAGLFLPTTARDKLPTPLANLNAIRLTEVLPDLDVLMLPLLPPAVSPKYASDLRYALTDVAFNSKPMRVEASLVQPISDLKQFRFKLKSLLPNVHVEGVVGSLVTFYVPNMKDLEFLATLPDVVAIRLPPAARSTVRVGSTNVGDVLATTNIRELHARGYKGADRRIVILASQFGNTDMLPANTQFIDLTPELSPTLDPKPLAGFDDGTPVALAARAAAPDATLILVRIDPAAFHQLTTIAKAIRGDLTLSIAQVARAETLLDEYQILGIRKDIVTNEYTAAMSNLSDDEKPATRREKAKAEMIRLQTDEAAFRVKYARMEKLRKGVESLKDAHAVINSLTWDDGYPVDGLSDFAQYLDLNFTPGPARSALAASRQPAVPTWVQAASESTWSVWSGPASDADGNRVLEFADAKAALPAGTWTRELNFLAHLKDDGTASVELPEGAKVRLVVQWREPHDPNTPLVAEPMLAFNLQLLKQYDPSGAKFATDELAVVGLSEGKPVRLLKTESAGVYEQTLEVTVPAAGRYATRVTLTPAATSRFAAETRLAEVYPKITVRPVGGMEGRIIFASFLVQAGGVGIPADSAGAFTVGRSNAKGQSLSLLGAGPGVSLRMKPEVLIGGDSGTATGSGISAATIGGLAACLADVGVRPSQLVGTMAIQANGALLLPHDWLLTLPQRQSLQTARLR
ncbi:hypothetical protein BH11PLA2_BH11PLA2_34780 [soil metagenome]